VGSVSENDEVWSEVARASRRDSSAKRWPQEAARCDEGLGLGLPRSEIQIA
jgi:hypothetical protein